MSLTVLTWIDSLVGKVSAEIRSRHLGRPALALAVLILIAAGICYRHSWNWGDFPTWILAAGAIVTVYYARRAFREQSEELAVLKRLTGAQTRVLTLQAKELRASLRQRQADAENQRRAQASKVTAWFGSRYREAHGPAIAGLDWGAVIRNGSDSPILNVRVFFYSINAASPTTVAWEPVLRGGPPERIRVIPPESDRFVEIPDEIREDECNDRTYAVSIEFSDTAGVYWERTARGALEPAQPTGADPDDQHGRAAPPVTT
jgi:hypothetical protein